MLKEILSNIVKSQSKDIISKETGIKREKLKEIDLKLNYAIIISGIRRCGKSTLLRQVIDNVKIPSYFNFEDPRATNFKLSDFENLRGPFSSVIICGVGGGTGVYYKNTPLRQQKERWKYALVKRNASFNAWFTET